MVLRQGFPKTFAATFGPELMRIWPVSAAVVVAIVVPVGLLWLTATSWRSPEQRVWRWFAVGCALTLAGAPGAWDVLSRSGYFAAVVAPNIPAMIAVGSSIGAYAILFSANLRLLRHERTMFSPRLNAWFDGVASLAGLAAILSVTAVPVLTAMGLTTVQAAAWAGRPSLFLVLVAFGAANCALAGWRSARGLIRVLLLLFALLAAEALDLVCVVGQRTSGGFAMGSLWLSAGSAGLRVVAVGLLLWVAATPHRQPRVCVDLGWSTVTAPISVFVLAMVAAFLRMGQPDYSFLAWGLEAAALGVVAAKLVVLTRTLISLLSSHRLALLDELTGLPNRRAFFAELDQVPDGAPVAVMLLDLDGFKQVNDCHGHHTGDLLLKDTADRLQDVVGAAGRVARLGGDEFVVVLTNDRAAQAPEIARELVERLGPREVGGLWLQVSASIGIAGPGAQGETDACIRVPQARFRSREETGEPTARGRSEALLHAADSAMYLAKTSGSGSHTADHPH